MNPLLLGPLADILKSVIGRIWPDPSQQAEAQLKLATMMQTGELAKLAADTGLMQGQIDVDKIEAASDSLFKSGWRPFVGWVCGGGLTYQLMARPVFGWVAENVWQWSPPPDLDMNTLMTLLFGILGLGVYRTFEKTKGVS
jgi:hypothetical protein